MEDSNAQKMLDLYIRDYLVRNNMQITTNILAEEAGMEPKTNAINPTEGFMSEWWDLFWDASSRLPNTPKAQGEGSSSSSQTSFPVMPPNMSQDQLMTLLMSQRVRAQEHQRLPPENFDANPNVFNFDQMASMLPMVGGSRMPISALSASRTIPPEPTHAPRLTQEVTSRESVEKIEESDKSMDEDTASFSSSDDSSDDSMDITYTQTSARKEEQQQDFPFGLVTSIQPSDNKLSCCDFSSQGKFLAAAGHEKKVFIWNVTQSTSNAIPIQAHSQIITDVRFQANSFMFATSSFDKTVKIWDATNTKKLLHNLVGHTDQVMSVDFHPKKTNIVCSCDSNDEIKYWHVKESKCFRNIKGANIQVRFQSRHGNLLAAATGKVINLIDVETGIILHHFDGHEEEVCTIDWDVCGEYLVSASQDSARIWSIMSGGRCVHALASTGREFTSSTFHPAYTNVVAIGSYESIYIWNPITGNRTWKFNAHQGIIPAMAHAPETDMIASVSHDHCIKIWK